MRFKILPMCFLLGCGGQYYYQVNGFRINSDIGIDNFAFAENVDLTFKIFNDHEMIANWAQYNSEFGDVVVNVSSERDWNCPYWGRCNGDSSLFRVITINRIGSSFMHELIHVWEMNRWAFVDTYYHTKWDGSGYWKMDREFINNMTLLTKEYELGVIGIP